MSYSTDWCTTEVVLTVSFCGLLFVWPIIRYKGINCNKLGLGANTRQYTILPRAQWNSLVVRLVSLLVCQERERGPATAIPAGISIHPIGRELHIMQHGPVT
jgi:hypothetical protein